MHLLLNAPLSAGCAIRFRKNFESYVDQSPFFRLSEILLEQINRAGSLRLTATGNLPVKICELLYNQNLIYWKYLINVKKLQENNIPYLGALKFALIEGGLVKKRGNALSLTSKGVKSLSCSKAERFVHLFSYFTSKLHWGNLYDVQYDARCGQFGWAYALLLLSKYGGEQQKSEFFSTKLILAFEQQLPDMNRKDIEEHETGNYHSAYRARFFECFANWFGLIEIEYKRDIGYYGDRLYLKKSNLFDQLFELTA